MAQSFSFVVKGETVEVTVSESEWMKDGPSGSDYRYAAECFGQGTAVEKNAASVLVTCASGKVLDSWNASDRFQWGEGIY